MDELAETHQSCMAQHSQQWQQQQPSLDRMEALQERVDDLAQAQQFSMAQRSQQQQPLQDKLENFQQKVDELAEAHQTSMAQHSQQQQQQQRQPLLDRLEALQKRVDDLADAHQSITTQQSQQQQPLLGLPSEVESLRRQLQSALGAGAHSNTNTASDQQQASGPHPLPGGSGTQATLGAHASEQLKLKMQAAIQVLDSRVQAGVCQLERKAREAVSLLQKAALAAAERSGEPGRPQEQDSGARLQPAAREAPAQAAERATSATSLQLQQLNADAADFVQQLADQAAAAQRPSRCQGTGQEDAVLLGREGFRHLALLVSSMGAAMQEAEERLSRLEPSHKALQGTVANLRRTTLDSVISLMDRPSFRADAPYALQADVNELRSRLNRLDWRLSRHQQVPSLMSPCPRTSPSGNHATQGVGQSKSADMACVPPPPLLEPALSLGDARASHSGAMPYTAKSASGHMHQREPGPLQKRISMMDGEGSKSMPLVQALRNSDSSSSEGRHASDTSLNPSLTTPVPKGQQSSAHQQASRRAQTDQRVLGTVSEGCHWLQAPRETALEWALQKSTEIQRDSGSQRRKSLSGVRFSEVGAGEGPRQSRLSQAGGDPYSGNTFARSFSRRRRPSNIEEELTESRAGSVFGSRRASLEDEAEMEGASADPTVFASPWVSAHVRTSNAT